MLTCGQQSLRESAPVRLRVISPDMRTQRLREFPAILPSSAFVRIARFHDSGCHKTAGGARHARRMADMQSEMRTCRWKHRISWLAPVYSRAFRKKALDRVRQNMENMSESDSHVPIHAL